MNEVPRRLERRAGVSPTQTVFAVEARVGDPLPCVTIDERTGIEVVAIAPAHATQLQMRELALAKLRRRLQNQS